MFTFLLAVTPIETAELLRAFSVINCPVSFHTAVYKLTRE